MMSTHFGPLSCIIEGHQVKLRREKYTHIFCMSIPEQCITAALIIHSYIDAVTVHCVNLILCRK